MGIRDIDIDVSDIPEGNGNLFDYRSDAYNIVLMEMVHTGDAGYAAMKANVPISDVNKLTQDPKFITQCNKMKKEYEQEGITPFDAKIKMASYMSLDELIHMATNRNEKAQDRREAAKLIMQMGGKLEKNDEGHTGPVVSFNFNAIDPLEANKQALLDLQEKLKKK